MQYKKRIFGVAILLCLGGALAQTSTGTGADTIVKVGDGVSPPAPLYSPDPEYSPEYSKEAQHAKYQGTCVLVLVVGADGRPRDVKVSRSLGHGLDEKAIEAVQQWRFTPAMKDGHPVAVKISVEINFRLYKGPPPRASPQSTPQQTGEDDTTHFTQEQLTKLAAQWNAKPSPEQLADLRTRCAAYIDKSLEDLQSKRVPLPPHECAGVPGWMRNLDVESWYVVEKPRP